MSHVFRFRSKSPEPCSAIQRTDPAIEVRLKEGTMYFCQKCIVDLSQTTKKNISLLIRNAFDEGELQPEATVKEYLTVQKERPIKKLKVTASGRSIPCQTTSPLHRASFLNRSFFSLVRGVASLQAFPSRKITCGRPEQ